jgi:hypothetical protein
MTKKIFIGMLAVFIVIAVASAGYKFGQYLAQSKAQASPESSSSSA